MGAASDQPEFDRCVDVVLAHEGGYVHHPADPGAATNFGITQSTLARARGRKTTETDVRLLSKEEACAIYRRFYWDTIRASEMSAGVALAVFDFAVNSGVPGAVRQLQSVLGIVTDGVVGADTLRALSRVDTPGLIGNRPKAAWHFSPACRPGPCSGAGGESGSSPSNGRIAADPGIDSNFLNKDISMIDKKTILSSRTVWSNLIGLAALGLGLFGLDVMGLENPAFADAIAQVVAAGGFIASTVFRIVATKQILN